MNSFFIDNFKKTDLVAAPLAGISNLPFRRILRKFSTGIIYSEMISAEGIARLNQDSLEYLNRYEGEKLLVYQLFGGKPSSFVNAIKVIEDRYEVEAYDINMGCPVRKVIKSGGGVSLLQDLARLKDIVTAVRQSTSKPFSIKIRLGMDNTKLVYKDVLKIAEGEGVDALTIHARTKQDLFSGTVRYDILEEVAAISKIPIIGNGSVLDYSSYCKMKSTGVDAVMLGRAMMYSPWIFKVIDSLDKFSISRQEILELLHLLYEYMKEDALTRSEEILISKRLGHYKQVLIKFALWFSKGFYDAATFRKSLYQTRDIDEIFTITDRFYEERSSSSIL